MNVTAMQTEVLETGQVNSNRYGARIITWLDDAQKYVVRQLNYRVGQTTNTFSTVLGDNTYTVPSDYLSWVDLYDVNNQQSLATMTIEDLDASDPTVFGQPVSFLVYGDQITLDPVPDGVYNLSLRYRKLPATLATGNDTPVIPAEYHPLLISYALSRCYRSEEDYDAMNIHWGEFQRDLAKMKSQLNHDAEKGPKKVGGTWGMPEYSNRSGSF